MTVADAAARPTAVVAATTTWLTRPCPLTGRVVASELPGGRVAKTVHWGSYAGIGDAHQAVKDWATANRVRRAGPFWEVYGPHRDDPAEVWTEIYYLLG